MSDDKVSVKEALEKLYDLSWMIWVFCFCSSHYNKERIFQK